MYRLEKTVRIAASHQLRLPYDSKCNTLHGHNYTITVYISTTDLNADKMILDFSEITKVVKVLDHTHLNDFLDSPTAEGIAKYIHHKITLVLASVSATCDKVKIEESEGSVVTYEL